MFRVFLLTKSEIILILFVETEAMIAEGSYQKNQNQKLTFSTDAAVPLGSRCSFTPPDIIQ